MAGRGDRNRDSGIGNLTLDNPEEEQDPALSDVGEDEDEAELEGLAGPNLPGLDEQLGLDPAAPRIRPPPPLPPQPSPPLSPQPSPPPPQPQHRSQPPIMAAQANGIQIALLPTFGGEAGSDVDMCGLRCFSGWPDNSIGSTRSSHPTRTPSWPQWPRTNSSEKLRSGWTLKDEEEQKQTFGTQSMQTQMLFPLFPTLVSVSKMASSLCSKLTSVN
jgi:hypothetical protein